MASVSMAPTTSIKNLGGGSSIAIERLPEEMNEMKIRDEKVISLDLPPSLASDGWNVIFFFSVGFGGHSCRWE
jgi:hypothetical protein